MKRRNLLKGLFAAVIVPVNAVAPLAAEAHRAGCIARIAHALQYGGDTRWNDRVRFLKRVEDMHYDRFGVAIRISGSHGRALLKHAVGWDRVCLERPESLQLTYGHVVDALLEYAEAQPGMGKYL